MKIHKSYDLAFIDNGKIDLGIKGQDYQRFSMEEPLIVLPLKDLKERIALSSRPRRGSRSSIQSEMCFDQFGAETQ